VDVNLFGAGEPLLGDRAGGAQRGDAIYPGNSGHLGVSARRPYHPLVHGRGATPWQSPVAVDQ